MDVFDGLGAQANGVIEIEDGISNNRGGVSDDSFSAQARPTFGNHGGNSGEPSRFISHSIQHSRNQSVNPSNNSSRINQIQIDTNVNEAVSDGTA